MTAGMVTSGLPVSSGININSVAAVAALLSSSLFAMASSGSVITIIHHSESLAFPPVRMALT
ncbi:MAG: hypothetical protein ACK55I_13425, partial [bacterium]